MPSSVRPLLSCALLLAATTIAACTDATAPNTSLSPATPTLQGGSGGGGGGGGGGGSAPSAAGILPATPPAPDILLRESFGPGPDFIRPAGGKGEGRNMWGGGHTIAGFWVEYPGNKDNAWITAPETGQSWRNCGGGDNSSTQNPFELPSPMQTAQAGCVASSWIDPVTQYPTALMPINFALPSGGYELSMEGYPSPIAGGYIAIGFTSSSAVISNLTSAGTLWLKVTDPTGFSAPLHYELRAGSLATGRLLASGDRGQSGWNHMAIRVSPASGTVTLNFGTVATMATGAVFSDTASVTVPFAMSSPKYIAFEGVGIIDDVVVRK